MSVTKGKLFFGTRFLNNPGSLSVLQNGDGLAVLFAELAETSAHFTRGLTIMAVETRDPRQLNVLG